MTEKQKIKLELEKERIKGMREFENGLVREALGSSVSDSDVIVIAGIDEAGRGPLAGPVAAGACILPADHDILYLNDSKKLSAKKRDMLFDQIKEEALAWSVGLVDSARIDEINILQATYEAMRLAISQLKVPPTVLVNDAVTIPGVDIPQIPVIKGDAKCISIAAASILAKVTRDRIMEEMDEKYPEYGFAKHKGYGTREHMDAIREFGPCPIHRRSFITRIVQGVTGEVVRKSGENLRRKQGNEMEDLAAGYLSERGVRILERNFRSREAEIDIIGRQGRARCSLSEVKARRRGQEERRRRKPWARPSRRGSAGARTFYMHTTKGSIPSAQSIRFDVVAITWPQARPDRTESRGAGGLLGTAGPAWCAGSAMPFPILPTAG